MIANRITSSARWSSDCAMVTPIAFAVFRLAARRNRSEVLGP
jgi:hypothetical protein